MHLAARDGQGPVVCKPSLHLVLGYEQQARRNMSSLINEGSTFRDALHTAARDNDVRDKYRLTPFTLQVHAPVGKTKTAPRPRGSRTPN